MNLTFWYPTGGCTNEWILNASTIGLSHLKSHLDNLELVNCKVFCEILKDSFIASKYIRAIHSGNMSAPANSTLWTFNHANCKFPICNQNFPLQFFLKTFLLHTPHSLHKITILQNNPKINSITLKLSCCHPFISTALMQMLTFDGVVALFSEMCSVPWTVLNH